MGRWVSALFGEEAASGVTLSSYIMPIYRPSYIFERRKVTKLKVIVSYHFQYRANNHS